MSNSRIKKADLSQIKGKTKVLLDAVKQKLGFLPNLIKVLASSPVALKTYLSLQHNINESKINSKFQAQIALLTAQENESHYCLSAHAVNAKLKGLNDIQIDQCKQGFANDDKIQAGLQFAQQIIQTKGKVSNYALYDARAAGISDEEMLEIISIVVANTYTNYVNNLAKTQIDFPVINTANK